MRVLLTQQQWLIFRVAEYSRPITQTPHLASRFSSDSQENRGPRGSVGPQRLLDWTQVDQAESRHSRNFVVDAERWDPLDGRLGAPPDASHQSKHSGSEVGWGISAMGGTR